jgi:hypothetical protein
MKLAQMCLMRLLCSFLPLLCSSAWADGKVFSRALAVPVKTPDQRASLCFSNGVERLVIETSFVGGGTNFAWVIPLPSTPKIEEVSTNFFEFLNMAFQPKLVHRASFGWLIFAFFGCIVSVSIRAYREEGPRRLATWLLFVLFVLLFVAIAIPSFVSARSAATISTPSSVSVLDRKSVGVYDTVTLSGRDGRALLEWLNAHGFYTPTSALPVISGYATQGWVFAAATINRDAVTKANSRPHPLSFIFSTDKAVYPLRLTGVENELLPPSQRALSRGAVD